MNKEIAWCVDPGGIKQFPEKKKRDVGTARLPLKTHLATQATHKASPLNGWWARGRRGGEGRCGCGQAPLGSGTRLTSCRKVITEEVWCSRKVESLVENIKDED